MNITSIIHLTKDVTETKKIVQEELTNGTNYFIAVGGDGTRKPPCQFIDSYRSNPGYCPRGSETVLQDIYTYQRHPSGHRKNNEAANKDHRYDTDQ